MWDSICVPFGAAWYMRRIADHINNTLLDGVRCPQLWRKEESQLLPKSVVLAREIILEQRGLLTPKLIGLK